VAPIASRAVTAVENTERVAAPPTSSPVLSARRQITSAAPAARLPAARTVLRVLLWAGLLLAFVATCAVKGLPTDRVVLLGWVLTGLTVHAAT
jgi:hypothetical protein